MEAQIKRGGSIPSLLVGLVLLVTVAGLFLGYWRSDCPECDHGQRVLGVRGGPITSIHDLETCKRCRGRGYISVWSKWIGKQQYPSPYNPPTGPPIKAPRFEITITVSPLAIPNGESNLPGEKK